MTRNKAAPATGGWKSSSNRLQRPRATTTLKLHMNFRTLTFMLAGLAMLGPFATDAYLPSFHSIGSEFEVSQAMVQQTLSLYLTCFALMRLVYGTLSDGCGGRPVSTGRLVVFVLGCV